MTHRRKEIRAAAVAALVLAGLADGRVFRSRVKEVQTDELPCALVYADEEEASTASDSGAREYRKDLTLRVKLLAGGALADEVLDDLSEVVEDTLARDESLGGLASQLVYVGMDQGADEEGQTSHIAAVLRFRVIYEELHPRIPDELPDFEEVHGGIDVTGDGEPEIEFQQVVMAP